MSSTTVENAPSPENRAEDRRNKVMRELKLALVDELQRQQSGGFNPYDSSEGRGHTERWDRRRR